MTNEPETPLTGLELVPLTNIVQELHNRYDGQSKAMILAFDHIDNPEDIGDHRIILAGENHRMVHLQSAINNTLLLRWMENQGLGFVRLNGEQE